MCHPYISGEANNRQGTQWTQGPHQCWLALNQQIAVIQISLMWKDVERLYIPHRIHVWYIWYANIWGIYIDGKCYHIYIAAPWILWVHYKCKDVFMCDGLDLLFTICWWWKSENSAVAPFHCSGPVSQDGHLSPWVSTNTGERHFWPKQIAGPPLSHMFFCTCCKKKHHTWDSANLASRTRDVTEPLSPRGHWGLGCCRRMSRTISSLSWTSVRSPPRIEKSDWWIDEWKIPMGNTHLVVQSWWIHRSVP